VEGGGNEKAGKTRIYTESAENTEGMEKRGPRYERGSGRHWSDKIPAVGNGGARSAT
jgi:hypothetical protein